MKTRLFLIALIAVAGCKSATGGDDTVIYSGTIVSRTAATAMSTNWYLHVKPSNDQNCGTVFTITDKTVLSVKETNGEVKKTSSSDAFTVGSKVDVYFSGIVATSCPGQAGADAVQVIK